MSQTASVPALDLRGKTITTYILQRVHEALAEMAKGQHLEVVTDRRPAIDSDVRAWCGATGHRLVSVLPDGESRRFVLEKGEAHGPTHSLAVVISDDGLEELLSPLGFGLAAALEGASVALYFQGPAVRVLTEGYVPRLHGAARPFSRFARQGLEKAGHVHPHEKIRQMQHLGARLFVCGGSMDHFKVVAEDLAFEDITISAYVTFMSVMENADVHIYV